MFLLLSSLSAPMRGKCLQVFQKLQKTFAKMKMKFFLLTIVYFLSFSAGAQTKEETIQWLSSKISKYGQNTKICFNSSGKYYFTQYSASIVSALMIIRIDECTEVDDNNSCSCEMFSNVSIEHTTNIETKTDCDGKKYFILYGLNSRSYKGNCSSRYEREKNQTQFQIDFNSEENLHDRMLKAFKTLISFNKPKNKEPF